MDWKVHTAALQDKVQWHWSSGIARSPFLFVLSSHTVTECCLPKIPRITLDRPMLHVKFLSSVCNSRRLSALTFPPQSVRAIAAVSVICTFLAGRGLASDLPSYAAKF